MNRISCSIAHIVLLVLLLVAVVLLSAGGCSSFGRDFDTSATGKIQKGVTTEAELVAMLGKPTSVSAGSDGRRMLSWSFSQTKVQAQSFIPVVGFFVQGADYDQKSLMVTIGTDGKVADYGLTQTSMD